MCGVTIRDRIQSEELYSRLCIDSISSIVTRSRLGWYGHVQRTDDKELSPEYEVAGHVDRG